MFPTHTRTVTAVLLVVALTLGGVAGSAAAQEDCSTACVDPGSGGPEVVPGGGVAFETPVIDITTLFLKAKKAFNEDFETFLKAKKAF